MHRRLCVAILCVSPLLAQTRLTTEESDKLVIKKFAADYPPDAAMARIQGPVVLDITVSDAGSVTSSKLIYGHPLLVNSAVRSVKGRKYRPYVADGKPAPFRTIVGTWFSPNNRRESGQNLAAHYVELYRHCLDSAARNNWSQAESVCSGALWMFGDLSAPAQRQAENADAGVDAVYRNLGLATQGLGDLQQARQYYSKAETNIESARANAADKGQEARYLKSIKSVLELHLQAAQQAGATEEVGQIQKHLAAL